MIHTNELVAAVLFSVGATLAGTELFCRFTAKYSDRWYVLALAYGIPVALLIIGVYFQFFVKPLKTVPTTIIPQPKPAPHDVWMKMNTTTRWKNSQGNILFMQPGLILSADDAIVASGSLSKQKFTGTDSTGLALDGQFSSDFTKFNVLLTESGVMPFDLGTFQSEDKWEKYGWSNTSDATDQKWYTFERYLIITNSADGTTYESPFLEYDFRGLNTQDQTDKMIGAFSTDLKTFTVDQLGSASDNLYTFQGYGE